MDEICAGSRNIKDESGKVHIYHYLLQITLRRVGGFSCESYNIGIREEGGESAFAEDFTLDPNEADAFLTALMNGTVTPVTLTDVAEDWKKARTAADRECVHGQ